MKKFIAVFLLFLFSQVEANAVEDSLSFDFYDCSKNVSTVYFNQSESGLESNFVFSDANLSLYIQKALDQNYSIKIAKDRIAQYQNLAKGVNSARLPQLSVSPQANAQRNMSTSSGNFTETGFYNLPVQLSWELDIWGKNSLKYKSAKLNTFAKEQELNMTKLTVITDLSVSYYNLVLTDYLISNTQERIKNLEETITLKNSLYKNGIINFDDIYLVKNEYSQTIEELCQYNNQQKIFAHQIYVLTGEIPKNTEELARSTISDLKIPTTLSLKNSEMLMFSRPDVMIAKSELDKAHIDVKVAQREFLPSLYLNELIGLSSLNFLDLFNWYSRIYQFGGQLAADLYTGGYKMSNLNYNREILREKLHNYYSVEDSVIEVANGNLDEDIDVPEIDLLKELTVSIKKMVKRLKNQIVRLSQLEQYKTNFLQNITHEIKTPITAINSAIELLETKNSLDENDRECFDIIRFQTKSINKLVNDILALSEIEIEKTNEDKNFAKINLNALVERAIAYMSFSDTKINFIQNEKVEIYANEELLMTAISNLLSNAIRYSESDKIDVVLTKNGSVVELSVTDFGVGIAEEHLGHIFERFYRVDKNRSRKLGGSGLGLAIVKNIVELRNGTISAESTVGKGTKFLMKFST